MPATTEPRSGLLFGWSTGENNWGQDMNANLLRLGRFGFHLTVKDRDLATPPASPSSGDSYIVASSATGAWSGQTSNVAVWTGSSWVFATPRLGWICFIEDELKLCAFYSGVWSAGISL